MITLKYIFIIVLTIISFNLNPQEEEVDKSNYKKMLKPLLGKWKIYKFGKCEMGYGCYLEDSCAQSLLNKTFVVEKNYVNLIEDIPCLNLGFAYDYKDCHFNLKQDLEIEIIKCKDIFKNSRWTNCSDIYSDSEDIIIFYKFKNCNSSIINHFFYKEKDKDLMISYNDRFIILKRLKKNKISSK